MKQLLIIITIFILSNCATTYETLPIKQTLKPYCMTNDKEAIWDDYSYQRNQLFKTRRLRQEYCVWIRDPYLKKYYENYCQKLEKAHTNIEQYTNMLYKRYSETCSKTKEY